MTEVSSMTEKVWHKGPPPEIGWWPASVSRNDLSIRWWNGECWSWPAYPDYSARLAADSASETAIPAYYRDKIEWTERWWL